MAQSHSYAYYIDGSAARRLERAPQNRSARRRAVPPKPQAQQPAPKLVVEPVALGAVVLAVVMTALLVLGCIRLYSANHAVTALEQEARRKVSEVEELEKVYRSGYDLEEIETAARSMGMIPAQEAKQITFDLPASQEPAAQEPSFWERFTAFFTDKPA